MDQIHKCGEACHCPVHQTMMYYWPKGNSHACQTLECEYARGYEDALIRRSYERWYRQ